MKYIHTFEGFINESKYKGNMSGDAAEYIANELSQYVKGVISQPNDAVTYFHLKNTSDKSKVIKTLLDVYGLEAVDGGNMFSPSPTIKFDNDQLLESSKGVYEGYMSELDIIRQESSSLEEFMRKGKAAFPKIAKMSYADDFFKELWEVAEEMKENK